MIPSIVKWRGGWSGRDWGWSLDLLFLNLPLTLKSNPKFVGVGVEGGGWMFTPSTPKERAIVQFSLFFVPHHNYLH